ncbi:MAG: metal ABC transporter permease [bacterium]
MEILQYEFMQRAVLASIFGGICCGIVGVWVIMLGIPFVGVAMSHAAFAGAVFGLLFHVNPLLVALAFCLASAAVVGPMADRADFDPNISIGIVFSIVLGIAFLGMGLIKGPKTQALKLIWGNILMISGWDIIFLIVNSIFIMVFVLLLFKEILAVLFNREIARAAGIPEKLIFYLMLMICGITVTLNLNTIGGLLIFSLIISPPAAAYQLTYNLKTMYILSVIFSVSSCLLGLFFSYIFNVPSGAVIIICASLIFGISLIFSTKRKVTTGESP